MFIIADLRLFNGANQDSESRPPSTLLNLT